MNSKIFLSLVSLSFLVFLSVFSNEAKSQTTSFKTVFILKQRADINSLAKNVIDPHSSRFEKPYTPAEIAKELSLPEAVYEKLILNLKKRGFQVFREDKTRTYLIVKSSQELLETTFGTSLHFDVEGFHFPESTPSIPEDLSSIETIVNLDNRFAFHPRMKATTPLTSTWKNNGYSPSQINSLYGFDLIHTQGFQGTGQKIATVAFNAVNLANVKKYFSTFHLSTSPDIHLVSVTKSPVKTACVNNLECGNEIENETDLEMAGRIAPNASLYSFVGTTDDYLASWVSIFTEILDQGDIFVVNNSDDTGVSSIGSSTQGCEVYVAKTEFIKKLEPLFQRAVAQGVTIFSASGDSGSDTCQDGTQGLDWPSGPNIVAVGGTDLSALSRTSETSWSGSGGGFSLLYPKPDWQILPNPSSTMRGTPDISFYAGEKPGQPVYTANYQPGPATWLSMAGTSVASPTMAGFLALVNEARQKQTKKPLPYLNPILYAMSASDRSKCFHDITTGSNGFYSATTGWDAVTGLGSPNAGELFKYLVDYNTN